MLLFNNCSSGRASSRSPPRRQKREQRATQTEEAPPPSRPTAAVPPVQIAADSGAGASSNGASNLLLNSAAAQPLSSTAAVPVTLPSTLERQWLAESFESLFRRARDLKQRVDAAIRGRRPTTGNLAGNSSTTAASAGADVDSNAKRHFLLASVLFLAGCWAVEERRSPGSDNGSTKRTYHEISQFIRHFIRVFHERHGGSPVSNSTSNSGSGSVAVGDSSVAVGRSFRDLCNPPQILQNFYYSNFSPSISTQTGARRQQLCFQSRPIAQRSAESVHRAPAASVPSRRDLAAHDSPASENAPGHSAAANFRRGSHSAVRCVS
ncbi:hypothetical protein BOX15_Mlig019200g1 [Macrostomum lignano]|uniref:Uncharacterized protein n=1 Tax=Macrostomum lignano TaxID=282301 RepID=A0A267F4R5_9PLAT|nr:hypothetical protein BOX15_Mlig019200g1 [Macrostomum lignano]